jgi:hypothetical protein
MKYPFKITAKNLFLAILTGFASASSQASWLDTTRLEADTLVSQANPFNSTASQMPSRFDLEGYGTLNFSHFDWDTDPARRAAVDFERLAIEATCHLSERIRINGEIEIEHGGTGASMEFDKVEEFGEFETEIEKGGEITVEEFAAAFLLWPSLNFRLGHFIVPIGFASVLDEPTDYYTVTRSEAESSMLPVLWDESGIELFGEWNRVRYQVQVINGLDATGFSSGNWVAGGHQGRFETVNAENLAIAARIESEYLPHTLVGLSGYFGNSADNRPKPDLHVPAYVSIVSAHAQFQTGRFTLRGLMIWGHLSNSEAVTQANKNLSNNLNVKRSPVGSQAYAAFVEAGFNVFSLSPMEAMHPCILFARLDAHDTMLRTDGEVFDNPYWNAYTVSGGVNYFPHPKIVFKGQYSQHRLGIATNNIETTYSFGLGVVF